MSGHPIRLCLETAGWEVDRISAYDEEGVEMTRFTAPDGVVFHTYGWTDEEIDWDEVTEAVDAWAKRCPAPAHCQMPEGGQE